MNELHLGDCLKVLKTLPENSIDSIVTDPPYGLSFMGKKWDYDVPSIEIWKECLRVLKPGGHLLAFSGSRTYHRMAVRIEDAGFEIRDQIMWVYFSGFPKSLNVGKAVDKLGGQSLSWFIDYILKVADEKGISRKELTMLFPSKNGNPTGWLWNKQKTQGITLEQYHKIKEFLQLPFADISECEREVVGRGQAGLTAGTIANFAGEKEFDITKGTSPWEGWGTALKPAHEPICMARKPLSEKSVAENCLKWNTGGINIDESRIGFSEDDDPRNWHSNRKTTTFENTENIYELGIKNVSSQQNQQGRFPANIIFDEEAGKILDQQSGGASRFFYCPKTSKKDRNEGLERFEEKQTVGGGGGIGDYKDDVNSASGKFGSEKAPSKNNHPTVKPTDLMLYLIRLVTPKGGTTLDPFMGSGSTGKAAIRGNFKFIGIEREQDFFQIAQARIKHEEKKPKQQSFEF